MRWYYNVLGPIKIQNLIKNKHAFLKNYHFYKNCSYNIVRQIVKDYLILYLFKFDIMIWYFISIKFFN
jgi:hypothetical protein